MGITLFLSALIFLSDFLIKTYLRHNLDPLETIPVIKNILHITLVFNRGAAFGVLQGKTTFLIYAAVIFVFIFLLVMKKEDKKNLTFWIASGLILG